MVDNEEFPVRDPNDPAHDEELVGDVAPSDLDMDEDAGLTEDLAPPPAPDDEAPINEAVSEEDKVSAPTEAPAGVVSVEVEAVPEEPKEEHTPETPDSAEEVEKDSADDDEDEEDEEEVKVDIDVRHQALKEEKKKKYIYLRGRKIPLKLVAIVFSAIVITAITLPALIWLFSDKEMIKVRVSKKDKEKVEEVKGEGNEFTESYFLEVPHFMVTIIDDTNDSSKTAYFKVQLTFELKSDELKKELEGKMPKIRESIVNIITNKKVSEINTTAGKLTLKDEIRKYINPFLQGGKVTEVYFTEFIYQL